MVAVPGWARGRRQPTAPCARSTSEQAHDAAHEALTALASARKAAERARGLVLDADLSDDLAVRTAQLLALVAAIAETDCDVAREAVEDLARLTW